MFEIKEKLIPIGKDRPGKLKKFIGVCIHDTGNTSKGAGAKSHANYETLNKDAQNNYVSYHYVVDDSECYRLVPEDERAWHSGDGRNGKGHLGTIAIEICINSDGDIAKATNRASELAADILKRHNIAKKDIKKYIYQHFNFSKKDCPRQLRRGNPYTWNDFLDMVIKYYV